MDQQRVDTFVERHFTELNAGLSCLNLYLGHRLGLFQALADARPVTSHELAQITTYSERYLREWLECMTAGEYLSYDPQSRKFSLPAEHAAALLDPDSPSSAIGVIGWLPSLASVLPSLVEAFRSGGGVPYEAYGRDMLMAQGLGTRPMFMNDLASKWVPAMPDIEGRLRGGGRVADVGSGIGWSSIAFAKGFPSAHIDAIDPDAESVEEAHRNVLEAGVSDRITFHLNTVEESELDGPYDLVTAFECIHDMPYPVSALRRMRELAAPDGAVLIADEAVGDTLAENTNFMGHFFYNFSVLHCLPQSMAFPNSAATGTVITPSTLRRYAQEAGFAKVEVLPIENAQVRFYRLTP